MQNHLQANLYHTEVYKIHSLTILSLLQEFSQTYTSVEQILGGRVQVRAKLGKGCHFTVLSKLKLHGASNLFHGFDLGSRSYSAHRQTYINGWSNTFEEELSFQEDLRIKQRWKKVKLALHLGYL